MTFLLVNDTKSNILSTQQKLEIVKKHFDENKTFSELSKEYNVSYTAVRSWCLNYEVYGEQALESKTGKFGNQQRTNSIDPKDKEIAILKKKLKYAEAENKILKKFDELMRNSLKKKS